MCNDFRVYLIHSEMPLFKRGIHTYQIRACVESVYYSVEELDALNRFETHKMVYALECNAVLF